MTAQEDNPFYTSTMARIHAGQGRYAEAVRIYRHLLAGNPDRSDLREALAAVLEKIPPVPADWPAAASTIRQWVHLLFQQQTLRRLQRIRIPIVTK
ncbi:hypothetical protein DSCO28_23240 [Desulfosarcina ovata subsp. sediminis]|uniref:Tetratricopeptide repeat protein n=1 Tax=Desulfosarcina ovata subsp. sediminis TaxID=885957 RepID=A0A5K7ZHS8_9BACT|nr:tetratricopeptide repeat protein [Desulfosarcina ovata]BBO81758.1 hypothetical protein DSCO28_23240 [Desulfosarcina ovata subsp. sediminis]